MVLGFGYEITFLPSISLMTTIAIAKNSKMWTKPPMRVRSGHAQEPQNQQDHANRPEHVSPYSVFPSELQKQDGKSRKGELTCEAVRLLSDATQA